MTIAGGIDLLHPEERALWFVDKKDAVGHSLPRKLLNPYLIKGVLIFSKNQNGVDTMQTGHCSQL